MAGLYESLMNGQQVNPNDPPASIRGTLPAGPGYVTSLQGDPSGPPVSYRSPDAPSPEAKPQQNPLAGLPVELQRWLHSEASRALEMQLKQQANRKAMGLE